MLSDEASIITVTYNHMKFKIPEDLKRKMEKFGVDWSPVIRRMIEREIQKFD